MIQDRHATPDIPLKRNWRWKPRFGKRRDHERNLIERFCSRKRHFRRVVTRYDKLAANLLGVIQPASMRLGLNAYEFKAW